MSNQYAFNYVYDDYIDTSAPVQAPQRNPQRKPQRKPQQKTPQQQQQYKRIGRTKDQLVSAGWRRLRINILKGAIVAGFLASLIGMAVDSNSDYNKSVQALADVNATYQASLEESNQLKQRIDALIADNEIGDIAERLKLQKIPAERRLGVDMS